MDDLDFEKFIRDKDKGDVGIMASPADKTSFIKVSKRDNWLVRLFKWLLSDGEDRVWYGDRVRIRFGDRGEAEVRGINWDNEAGCYIYECYIFNYSENFGNVSLYFNDIEKVR